MGFVDRLGSLLGGARTAPRAPTRRRTPGSEYMRGGAANAFVDWWPALRDAREDVRAAYTQSAARTIDMLHNSGWIAGVVNKGCSAVLGTGLKLALKPEFETLGMTQGESAEWARKVERRWELWAATALECDAAGKGNVHQLAKAALRSWFGAGEWVAWHRWIERPESKTASKIALIPAHRMTQEGSSDNDLFQGVRVNADGLPRSYRFKLKDTDFGITEIAARDRFNRPVIRHCFDGDVGQMRGISVFAPTLQVLRQYDQLSNATLSTALAQALVAATIESPSPTQDVLQAFDTAEEQGVGGTFDSYAEAKAGWYENTNFNLGGLAKIIHLFSGEKLTLSRSETPNSSYEPFARFLMREIASGAGFTFEDVTGDYIGATYSSIKMSTTTNWPIQLWRRNHIAAPFYQSSFECWLEEDIELGMTPFPGGVEGFRDLRAAACRSEWRGSAKPVPDEVKFAAANETLYGLGVTTQEAICAEMGADWEDVQEQLAREAEKRKKLGLPDPVVFAEVAAKNLAAEQKATKKKGADE